MPGLKKGIKQIKMQNGGTKRQTREAISKRLKAKGLADVTKEELDRFKKRQKFKGSDKEALRMLLNQRKAKPKVVGTELDDPRLARFKDKEAIKKSQEQIKAGVKKAEQRRKTEKKRGRRTAGAALTVAGTSGAVGKIIPKILPTVTATAKNVTEKAKKFADETRKTIKSATGVGVGKGKKGTQTERDAFNVIRGNISAKTVKRGRNLRKGAKIGAPTITAAAKAKAEQKERNMRLGGTFKGTF